jgi:hypothetical protein
VSVVLPPRLLLLVADKSAEDAICESTRIHPFVIFVVTTNIGQIFIPVFQQMSAMHKELEDDEEMVNPAQVAGMFVDWTDPQKAV